MIDTGLQAKASEIETLISKLRSQPKDADLWVIVGETFLETGQFENAVRAFDIALQLEPMLHRARIGLAIAVDLCDTDVSEREAPRLRTVVWEALQAFDALLSTLAAGRNPFVDFYELRVRKETARRLARNPTDADAMFLNSALHAKEGAFREAVAILDQLAATGVDYPGAREFRNQLEALMSDDLFGPVPPTS